MENSSILDFLLTTTQATYFIEQIDTLMQCGYNHTKDMKTVVYELFPLSIADMLSVAVFGNQSAPQTSRDYEQKLMGLKEEITRLPQVRLTLAFEPTEGTIKKIRRWLQPMLPGRYLLDIHIEKSLWGGAKVQYNGKGGDYSLVKQYEKL